MRPRSEPLAPDAALRAGCIVRILLPADDRPVTARILRRGGFRIELHLSVPLDLPFPLPVRLQAGGDAAYWFDAELVAGGSASVVEAAISAAPPRRVQRREDFRVRVSFPVRIEHEPVDGVVARMHQGIDLSAGGCVCLDPERRLRRGTQHRACLRLPGDPEPLDVHAEVVRRARVAGAGAAALQFLGLRDCDRERIVRALFREHRRRRERE